MIPLCFDTNRFNYPQKKLSVFTKNLHASAKALCQKKGDFENQHSYGLPQPQVSCRQSDWTSFNDLRVQYFYDGWVLGKHRSTIMRYYVHCRNRIRSHTSLYAKSIYVSGIKSVGTKYI